MHTDTRKYGDGANGFFIIDKNILFGFIKIPATGAEIYQRAPQISHQIQPLKYTRKIYTHRQENMETGSNGTFYNRFLKKLFEFVKIPATGAEIF